MIYMTKKFVKFVEQEVSPWGTSPFYHFIIYRGHPWLRPADI